MFRVWRGESVACRRIFRQIISDWQKLCYIVCFIERKPMPPRAAKPPVRSSSEEHKRAQRIFARLVGGESIRAIAADVGCSVGTVHRILKEST